MFSGSAVESEWRYGDPKWILCQTKPKKELWAKQNVENQGCEAYLPMFRPEDKRSRFGKPISLQPLFPSYLFVLVIGPWYFLKNTFGVSRVVMLSGSPAEVRVEIVTDLKRRQSNDGTIKVPEHRFDVGDEVQFKRGPFEGQRGVFDGIENMSCGKRRCRVLLGMLKINVEDYLLDAA